MGIIISFILKNIREKILRTLLITISVAAACSLFFASSGISDSYKSAYINMIRSAYGSSDIIMYAQQKAQSPYFMTNKADFYKDRTDYIIGEMDGIGSYEASSDDIINVSIKGINYDDLMQMNPVNLLQQVNLKPFTGNKIIISENMASKYNFKVGDNIKIKVGDKKQPFTIVGIAQQASVFKLEKNSMLAVIPRETMSGLNIASGKVSTVYIKAKNASGKQQLIQDLSASYKNCSVKETINQQEIDQDLSTTKTTFFLMLTIVLIMSIFIIYTAFKVIIMERMPIIGTFRSIGATKKMTNIVLITESIIYGIIGGVLGDIFGIGILYVVGVLMNPYKQYFKPTLEFRSGLLVEAFMFGVFISFISALLPILKVSRISVKDIVLNNLDNTAKNKYWKIALGILMIAFGIIAPLNPPKDTSLTLTLDVFAMICIVGAVIIFIPYITTIFVKLLSPLYSIIFGNEGILAAKNLKNNKSILNNICLLSIGISALLMINVLSFSLTEEVSKAYGAFKCDIWVSIQSATSSSGNELEKKIAVVDGVTDTAGIKSVYNAEVDIAGSSNNTILEIDSVDTRKFMDHFNVGFTSEVKGVPQNFDDGRYIMISSQLKSKFNVNIGDTITLKTDSGKKGYKVAAVFNSLMMNGSYAFIPMKYIKSDFKVNSFDRISVKVNKDSNVIKNELIAKFKGKSITVRTLNEMEAENQKANNDMMAQLKAFPFISIIIGAFGIINNFIISFIDRKRSLAVLCSIGMSRAQNIKMLFIEALSVGLIGSIMGIVTGLAMITIAGFVMKAIIMPLPMHYTASIFIICFLLGVAVTLIASLAPALRSSKLNVIEAIKYE